jgi:hypothetical protein
MSLLRAMVARKVLDTTSLGSGGGADVAFATMIPSQTIVGGGAPGTWQPLGQLNAISVAEGDAYLVLWAGAIQWVLDSGEELEITFRTVQPGASEFTPLTDAGSILLATAGAGELWASVSGVVLAEASGELPIQLVARNDSAAGQIIASNGALYAIKADLS